MTCVMRMLRFALVTVMFMQLHNSYSQTLEAAQGKGIRVDMNAFDSLRFREVVNPYDTIAYVSGSENAIVNNRNVDSLNDFSGSIKNIYSDKILNKAYDSIVKYPDTYKQFLKNPESIDDKDLIEALNEKFPASPAKNYPHQLSQGDLIESLRNEDLPNLKIPELSELPPLPHGQYKDKYLSEIKELREQNLKQERLDLTELPIDSLSKIASFKRSESFFSKTYFEGIIGILQGKENVTLLQLTPSLGYHFTSTFSMGVGPTMQIKKEAVSHFSASFGARTFMKLEIFEHRAYLQLEDWINFPALTYREKEQHKGNSQHNLLVGGGYLFPISTRLALNLSAMYRITENSTTQDASPFLFRIGISSLKTHSKQ